MLRTVPDRRWTPGVSGTLPPNRRAAGSASVMAGGARTLRLMDGPEPSVSEPDSLTEVETEMLAFEEHWWKYAGAKEAAIRERFDMS